jgi:hypothetical protein
MARSLQQQSVAGCVQRCAGRDDVIDHEHGRARDIGTGCEFGRIEPLSPGPTGLGHWYSASIEQTAAGQAELPCDSTCDFLTLIEPTVTAALRTRRGPGHRLEVGVLPAFDQSIDQQTPEMPRNLTPVAVLQRQHHITRPPGEGNCGNNPVLLRLRQPTNECNATGSADRSTRSLTAGATCFEHHVTQHDNGVSQSSAAPCASMTDAARDQEPGNKELDLIRQGVHPLNVSQRWPRPTPQPGPILADLPVTKRSTQLDTERCSGRCLRHAGVRRGVRRRVPADKSEDLTRSARANDHHRQGKQASRHKVRNIIEARRDLPETLVTIVATSHHCIHCVDCPIRKRTWCSAD